MLTLPDKFEQFYTEIESRPEFGLLFDLIEPCDRILNSVEFEARDVTSREKFQICDLLYAAYRLVDAWGLDAPRAKLFKLIVSAVNHVH